MRRHSHDGARAVAHHDVVGDPDWDLLTIHRIGSSGSSEDAGLVFIEIAALEV